MSPSPLHLKFAATFVLLAASPGFGRAQTPPPSFAGGQRLAEQILEQQEPSGVTLQADRPPIGYIIAEGDSWFSYPGLDVLGALSKQTLPRNDYYKVYSAASAGDTVESMAYDGNQLDDFASEFVKLRDAGRQKELSAILLSGGGNDIAGREFHVLLNHASARDVPKLDVPLAAAFIDRLGRTMESLIGSAVKFSNEILGLPNPKIVIHGYAEPVPDGRPFGIGWPLPGPWLMPGFVAKGYAAVSPQEIDANAQVMNELITMFNGRLAAIPARLKGFADVRYVDVRAELGSTVLDSSYRADWSNELHPTNAGFRKVALAFHTAIQR